MNTRDTIKHIRVEGRTFTLRINEWGTVTIKGLPGWFNTVADARKALKPVKQRLFKVRF